MVLHQLIRCITISKVLKYKKNWHIRNDKTHISLAIERTCRDIWGILLGN